MTLTFKRLLLLTWAIAFLAGALVETAPHEWQRHLAHCLQGYRNVENAGVLRKVDTRWECELLGLPASWLGHSRATR